MPVLSLILPVYNVENYLKICLDSILTALESVPMDESIEIICVDDGSPDRCGEILESYRAPFTEILPVGRAAYTIIHQTNAGVSTARNTGLKAATGEWIWFIDSDDSIAPFSLSYLIRALREHPVDILKFGHQDVDYQTVPFPTATSSLEIYDLTKDTDRYLVSKDCLAGLLLWHACYRREAIGEICFLKGIQPSEDTLFAMQIVSKSTLLARTHAVLYNYLQRPGSCMKTMNLKQTTSALTAVRPRYEAIQKLSRGRDKAFRLLRFKWIRNAMCEILDIMKNLPASEYRQLFPLYYEIGIVVFDEFPFYSWIFRTHCLTIVLLFLYFPLKVRALLLRIKFVSWLKTQVRGY